MRFNPCFVSTITNLQSSSDVHTNTYVRNTCTTFRHLTQSTSPGYSERQKDLKKPDSLKKLQKPFLKYNEINAVTESSVHPKLCSSQSHILKASACKAHCFSLDSAMSTDLAAAIPCRYLEL